MWIITLFFTLILVAGVQVLIFSRLSLKRLTYHRSFTPAVVNEGDTVTMLETIRNEKLLPLPWIRIEAGISSDLVFGSQRAVRKEHTADSDAVRDGVRSAIRSGARQYHRSIFSLGPYSTVTRRHKVPLSAPVATTISKVSLLQRAICWVLQKTNPGK